ncbi:hypothetical protein D3C81_564940 [compost metagenome]
MLVDELHRILHRQYVAVAVLVAITDHGRLGGGLASPRGTDEQHQPAFGHGHILQDGGQYQLLEGGNTGLDTTQHHARHILLPEGADPESAKSFAVDGVVCLPAMQVSLEVRLVQAIPDQGQRRLPVQRPPLERYQASIDLEGGRGIDRDEEIRSLLFNQCSEQNIHVHSVSLGMKAS